jgi:tRNA modification GTPase
MIRDGRQIAILGKPNVGKSSLFNWLVGSDRAIVAEMPGTTRDLVTESVDFEGIRLGVVDTAGIRDGVDEVEREGVERARRAAGVADVVLLVCDCSRPFDEADGGLLTETAGARRIIVWNKKDLVEAPAGWSSGAGVVGDNCGAGVAWAWQFGAAQESERGACSGRDVLGEVGRLACEGPVVVSLKTGEGLEELRAAMRAALESEDDVPRDTAMVTNLRHESLLGAALESLKRAIAGLDESGGEVSEELVLADIGAARKVFEEVTGRRTTEDVLGHIFSRFCVGK